MCLVIVHVHGQSVAVSLLLIPFMTYQGGKQKKFLSKSAARGRSSRGRGKFGRFKTK